MNKFYKYNGPNYIGLIPGCVYDYLGTNSYGFSRFADESGREYYIKDISNFNRSGMNPNNWEKRNKAVRMNTPERKPYCAYPSDGINASEPKRVEHVNHPSHYNQGNMEVIDMMIKLYGIEKVKAFCELNAFKYRMRAGYKGGPTEDISKAVWYENKLGQLNNAILD